MGATSASAQKQREFPAVSEPDSGPEIAALDVTRDFRGTFVLDDVSLEVSAGQIHALLGPNGAGKTTLLRILAGIAKPSSGTIRVAGLDAATNPHELRRPIAVVPSGDRSFYLRISGLENLVFFARLHGMRRKEAITKARAALAEVGLSEQASKMVGLYSQGMQKRLSVARALLNDASVLLVDEATQGLDPEGARRVRDLVANAAHRGAAVIWATQLLDEIRGFADRVTLLDRGQVRFAGTVPELMSQAAPRRHLLRLRNCLPPGPLSRRPRGTL